MIVGSNTILNQYVPTFYIKDLLDGQMLRYNSTRRAFVNVTAAGGSGATRLGGLDDVSSSVDNPLSLQNGQSLVYNSFTSLWENQLIGGSAGTAGQILTSSGSGLMPTWQTPASTTVTLTGDVTGTGAGTVPTTLATVNTTVGTFGSEILVPQITVDSKGRITSITTQHVDTSARDYIEEAETLTIAPRHQYIVTSQLEVDGLIENYGVLVIL